MKCIRRKWRSGRSRRWSICAAAFDSGRKATERADGELQNTLYQQIGQLKVELDWVKKKLDCSVEQKRGLVEFGHSEISLGRQCELLGLARSSLYYHERGESERNLKLLRLLNEQYTRTPFYGVRRMTAWLGTQGEAV